MSALTKRMEKRVLRGLEAAVQHLAEQYSEDVDIPVEYSGTQVIRSVRGEYPRRETGTGQTNIGFGVNPGTFEAAAGMKDPGIHLYELRSPDYGRKYMDDTFFENIDALREAFIAAATR